MVTIMVRHRNQRWEVSVDGVTRRMVDWLCTKERALCHALELANTLTQGLSHPDVRVAVEDREGVMRAP